VTAIYIMIDKSTTLIIKSKTSSSIHKILVILTFEKYEDKSYNKLSTF